jgi:opacity protein-like surface antigen
MKKFQQHVFQTLTALALLVPFTSFAGGEFDNGFFVGAKIGGQEGIASWDQHASADAFISINNAPFTFLVNDHNDQDGHAFHSNLMGNVSVGYARVLQQFFLAAEFSVNLAEKQEFDWHDNEAAETLITLNEAFFTETLNTKTKVTIEDSDIILDLRPGIIFAKKFLFYGRLGVAFNELSLEQQATTTLNIFTGPTESVTSHTSKEDNVAGLRAGLGIEYKLTPYLGINMDYVFTDYGTIEDTLTQSHTYFSQGTEILLDETVYSKVDVYKNTGTVGVNWYFGGKK